MPNKKCPHGHEKSKCQECGGGSICEHGIVRGTCSICDPQQVFRRYQRKSIERGLPFLLTEDQFRQIVSRRCYLCGESGQPRGIDRRDNHQGYVLSNVAACCGHCNLAKRTDSVFEFVGHVRKIAAYQQVAPAH